MAGAERGEEAALEQGLLAPEVSWLDHFDRSSGWGCLTWRLCALVFSDDEWRLSICRRIFS